MFEQVSGNTARISMFGLRWINATGLRWHARANCPVLKSAQARAGWTPFPVTLGYGRDTYTPCKRCTTEADHSSNTLDTNSED